MEVDLPQVHGQRVDAGRFDKPPGLFRVGQPGIGRPVGRLPAHAGQHVQLGFDRGACRMGLQANRLHARSELRSANFSSLNITRLNPRSTASSTASNCGDSLNNRHAGTESVRQTSNPMAA